MIKPQIPTINWGNTLTSALVFDAPLFERAGATTVDVVRKVPNAFISTPTWTKDILGSGIKFNGGSLQYTKSRTKVSTAVNNFTMECWFVPTAVGGEQLIFYNGNDNGGYGIGTNGSTMEILFGGSTRQISTSAVANGIFYQLVMVRSSGTTKLYSNTADTGLSFVNAPAALPATSFTTIGDELDGSNVALSRGFTGSVFLGRIWERALLISEIRQLYLNPYQIYQVPTLPQLANAPASVVASAFNVWKNMMGVGF